MYRGKDEELQFQVTN